jgi:hypothetical protein
LTTNEGVLGMIFGGHWAICSQNMGGRFSTIFGGKIGVFLKKTML